MFRVNLFVVLFQFQHQCLIHLLVLIGDSAAPLISVYHGGGYVMDTTIAAMGAMSGPGIAIIRVRIFYNQNH